MRGEQILTPADRRLIMRIAVANIAVLSVLATAAWVAWAGLPSIAAPEPAAPVWLLATRAAVVLIITFVCGVLAVGVSHLARPLVGVPPAVYGAACLLAAVIAGLPHALVLARLDDTPVGPGGVTALWAAAALAYVLSIVSGVFCARLLITYRRSDELRRAETIRAADAAAELEGEELRVRQLLADRLHGAVQNRLVITAAHLDEVAAELDAAEDTGRAARLRELADALDALAQGEVRAVSHTLFPTGANLDAFDAVRLLLARLPSSVATSMHLGPGLRPVRGGTIPIPVPLRLVVVYTIEEAVTNAVKHGAHAVRVRADLVPDADGAGAELRVQVDDDGCGLTSDEPALHGLERHRSRIEARGGSLRLEPSPAGGARLGLTLPITADDLRRCS